MAFVLEKISKEDKEKYGFELSPNRWVIDREVDMFLINVGGFGMTSFTKFELHVGMEIVKIVTDRRFVKSSLERDAIYDIDSIGIPASLKARVEEIKLAITDSLKKYGYFGDPDAMGEVEVNLFNDSKIHFIK